MNVYMNNKFYNNSYVMQPEELDQDMLVDAALCLWNKCKVVFQKYQSGSMDNPRYLQRMESPSKVI